MLKQVYRCILTFTEEKFKKTLPSNLFYRAETPELAAAAAISIFKEELVKNRIPNAKFRTEVYISSEEEIAQYKAGMQTGQVSRNMN